MSRAALLNNGLERLLNIGLRSTTLGIRFLFLFLLVKYLEPSAIGFYGLFVATLAYCTYFAGLDFYVYQTREILRSPEGQRGHLLKAQAALSGVMYLVMLPVVAVFLKQAGWPGYLAYWFIPILLLEHFNQEVSRLLIALSEQITASLILFVRQGSWAIAVVVLMGVSQENRNLNNVMMLWATAGVAAAVFGLWKVKRLHLGNWCEPVDWRWVWRGVKVSAAFLIATLALRGIQTLDRYWLEALGGIETVGAYVLFLGVASALMTFLDAGVFAFTYPALIQHSHAGEHEQARIKVRKMLVQTLVFSAAFGVASWFLMPYLLDWVANPVYKKALYFYPWLLMATVLNAVGMVPHFALYARAQDRPIIYSHLASLPAFILATWALGPSQARLAIPIALNIAFAVILVWKTWAYLLLCKRDLKL